MLADFRYALRALGRRPAFAAAVVLTLVLVIGASVAIVSIIQGLLFRPLPYPAGDRLVAIEAIAGGEVAKLAIRELRDITRDSRVLEDVAAFYPSQYNVTGGGPPEALITMIGTSNLFRVFGVPMLHGDTWAEALDFQLQYTVVLGHSLWIRRYGGDPSVVGKTVQLDGAAYTVTGVLPPRFDYPVKSDLYRAVTNFTPLDSRRFTVVARMSSGVTIAEAQAELDGAAARFEQVYPETNRGLRFRVRPLRDVFVGPARPYLLMLAVAVTCVLLIACANITNLMLARAIGQRSEFAVRTALGAGRLQMIRLVVAEAAVLATLGGLGGFLLGRWAVAAILAFARFELPQWITVTPDWITGVATALLSLGVTCTLSLLPSWRLARADVGEDLAAGSRRAVGNRREQRALSGLVTTQVAFAVVVLAAAVLMTRTIVALTRVDPGFDAASAVTFRVDPPWTRYESTELASEFYRRAIERLAALPGATGATSNMALPFGGMPDVTRTVAIEGRSTSLSADDQPFVNFQAVSPNYFHVMNVPVLAGRTFTEQDRVGTMPVAVLSARAAKRFWPGQDAVGKRLRMMWRSTGTGVSADAEVVLTVIGVVGDVHFEGLATEPGLDLYASHFQTYTGDTFLVVTTDGNPASLARSVAQAVREIDPEQSVFDIKILGDRMAATVWQQRTSAAVIGALGVLSLILAAVGIYGVLAYVVNQRRRELGVRRAIGAANGDLMRLVFRRGMTPVVTGVLIGSIAALAAARGIERMLFGVSSYDALSLGGSAGAILLVAIMASWFPVRRALRVDPAEALRN